MSKKKKVLDDSDEEEYSVEKIIDKRIVNGKVEYFLKWRNYSDADNTWEPEDNLDCPDLIEEFEKKYSKKQAAKSEKKSSRHSASSSNVDESESKDKKKVYVILNLD